LIAALDSEIAAVDSEIAALDSYSDRRFHYGTNRTTRGRQVPRRRSTARSARHRPRPCWRDSVDLTGCCHI